MLDILFSMVIANRFRIAVTSRCHKECQVPPAQATPAPVFCALSDVQSSRIDSRRPWLLGVVPNEAGTTSLIICSEHNEVRVAIDRRQMRLVRRVDIVKCLMKNDKKVDD